MAKRRVNQKFLAFLAGGTVLIAALGVGALKFRNLLFPKHPEKYIAAGREALARKDYIAARDNLSRAAGLSHPDASLDVMLGDAVNGLSDKDPDNVAAAKGLWEQALTIDPSNVEAMERLIQFWKDELDVRPRSGDRTLVALQLQKAADRLVEADPTNHFGEVNQAEATVETLADGIQTDAAHLALATKTEQKLLQLESEDPADADIPYTAARAYLWQAQEAARSGDLVTQADLIASAQHVMSDAAAQQPDVAAIRYRYGQVLLQIAAADINNPNASAATRDMFSKAVRQIDEARRLVTPDDPKYIEINLFDARLVLSRPEYAPEAPLVGAGDPAAPPAPTVDMTPAAAVGSLVPTDTAPAGRLRVAESIYRDVLSHCPNDPPTRIALAELLASLPGRRDEAITLLSAPMVDDHPTPGVKGTMLPLFQAQANSRLLAFEIDRIEATREPDKRASEMTAADALCDRLYGRSPDSPTILGLKGRLQLAHGQVIEATQSLRRAVALTDAQDVSQQLGRYELMFNLARACEAAQQTGDAKKLAGDVVAHYSHFIPARLMLARLLITEHDFDDARPQIDFLESIVPFHPELTDIVARMRIATLDPVQDAAKIKQYYDSLPEVTAQQRMDKAAFAHLINYDGEALRLMTLVHASSPGEPNAARSLISWYQSHGQNDQAAKVLSEALAANPSDTNLLALQLQMQGANGQASGGATPPNATASNAGAPNVGAPNAGALASTPADAFNAEWAQVEVARSQGDLAAVDADLAAAEKLKPDEPRVWDAIFTRALEAQNWDRASTYLEKLASANIDHAGGALYRIRYELARQDNAKAEDLALQLTRDKPEFSQSWSVLGQVQKSLGKYEEAIASYQQALQRQVQNLEAIRGIVECSYATSNTQRAKQYIDMGRHIAPSNEAFKEMELSYELTYGDPQNVIPARLAALQAAPADPQPWLNLATAYNAAAQSRAKAQDAAASADYYQKALSLLQEAMGKFPLNSKFAVFFARVSLDRGDFASAEQAMLNFTSQPSQAGRPGSAMLMSEFYTLAGKNDQAAKVLGDYLAAPFVPSDHAADVDVQLRLSGLLSQQNRFDDAMAALTANANDPSIIRQRVALLITAGRLADAQKMLADLAAAAPLSPDLLCLKGLAQMSDGKLADARASFDQVIASHPNNIYALSQRARVELRQVPPDFSGAIADLIRARDLAPQDMQTRLELADAENRRGRPDDQIHELESALHVAPNDKQVRLRLIDAYANAKPPRWDDADRLLSETHQMNSLAGDADVMHEEAFVDLKQGELSKANELIVAAMAKSPDNLSMVHTYYDVLLKSSDFDQLLAHSSQLLATNKNAPALWWVYPYRAQAIVDGSQDRAGAANELENGLAAADAAKDLNGSTQVIQTYAKLLGPDAAIKVAAARAQTNPHWLVVAASLCQQKGDPDAAITWLEQAMAHPDQLSSADQSQTLHLAAEEYLAKTPPDTLKSADVYRLMLKRSPDDMESLNNLACILVEAGPAYQPKEALECSEHAYNLMIRAGQDEPMIKDTYGWALIANGRSEQGLGLIQEALGKHDFAEGHYHMAEGLLKRQPPSEEDAANELTKAMQLLDQDERDGKPVDIALKTHVLEELKRTRDALAG